MTRHAVRQLTTDDAESAGALLGRTFAAEAWTRDLIADPQLRLHFCTVLYSGNTRWSLHRGSVWGIEAEQGVLGGVLNLIDKPCPEMTDAEASAYGFDEVDAEWAEVLAEFDRLEGPAKEALEIRPGPWTYVNVLGVDPVFQGRGLGSTLMASAIATADHANLPMGLITDSERNVRFYRRLGFEIELEGREVDPLVLWAMVRPGLSPSYE